MKASNECLYPTDVFLVSCGMGCKRITVSDIAYIEAMKDNCVIHMIDGKCYTQSCPMGDIEPELNPNMFKRITVLSSSTLATSICTIMGMLFWRMVWKYTLVTSTVMP
nr:LytTR family DNA-binding domain-containing protein [Segatella copri]